MSLTEHPEANAAEEEAPLKLLMSMPAKSETVHNYLDNIKVETFRKDA